MNPSKVSRAQLNALTDLPNIGRAGAADLALLGIFEAKQLIGQCPFEMYDRLCLLTAIRHDPCVIDVFISVTRFMAGEAPKPWWAYTLERKRAMSAADKSRESDTVDKSRESDTVDKSRESDTVDKSRESDTADKSRESKKRRASPSL
jgi:hypothetical protein